MSEIKSFSVLFAPEGQLSGDGQLRESFFERRDRRGADYPMWYLSPELAKKFQVPTKDGNEAVVAEDPSDIAWLKLRFGGERCVMEINPDQLKEIANNLPPFPKRRDISIKR
tara:strand:+ start:310 stop:645 length:336 start_codon:yes stop_codon:yes gene_type:complete